MRERELIIAVVLTVVVFHIDSSSLSLSDEDIMLTTQYHSPVDTVKMCTNHVHWYETPTTAD